LTPFISNAACGETVFIVMTLSVQVGNVCDIIPLNFGSKLANIKKLAYTESENATVTTSEKKKVNKYYCANAAGRLKMREWKMRHEHNCMGGKCRSVKCRSR